MGVEIERKYLVDKEKWDAISKKDRQYYRQGYILTEPAKTVRIRITDTAGYITIKGKSTGASRSEYEYDIPKQDAQELLDNFCSAVIAKYRYKIHVWEVDEFLQENEGLLLAEIELSNEEETFVLPQWLDKEVTGDERYYNSYLSLHPYKTWES